MEVTSSLNWLSWIIFGALAGWVASMIAGQNDRQGWVANIIVGIIGAFVGGALISLLTGGGIFNVTWNLWSFIAAVVGALILLFIMRMVRGNT